MESKRFAVKNAVEKRAAKQINRAAKLIKNRQ